jgi:transcriptional regulator EpsA
MDILTTDSGRPRLRKPATEPAGAGAPKAVLQPVLLREVTPEAADESSPPTAGGEAGMGLALPLQGYEADEVLLNIDASLRVHTRPHFFSWTQGLLQNLVRHRVLVCVLPTSNPDAMYVDTFSMNAAEGSRLGALFGAGGSGHQLVRSWAARRYRPVTAEIAGLFGDAAWQREFERMGAARICAHGMHDARGGMTSFFVFGCEPDASCDRNASALELAVPFLHAAWVRTRMHAALHEDKEARGARPEGGGLTEREREILRWIYFGKSNFEIGAILGISPLTVKNHVQKILRKLNVVNRAQAVGKALERHVIEP